MTLGGNISDGVAEVSVSSENEGHKHDRLSDTTGLVEHQEEHADTVRVRERDLYKSEEQYRAYIEAILGSFEAKLDVAKRQQLGRR